ncbi:MAG: carboxypeptidase M32 [Ignavibacteria bacterium]|nr:carboxypeptidase M32 [Ignavibacteria bacterium]
MHTIRSLDSAMAILGWDQETYMPDGAAEARAEQISALAGLRHSHVTADETRKALEEAMAGAEALSPLQQGVVRQFANDVQRATKLPQKHVQEIAKASSLGQDAWKRARLSSDFTVFQPALERITELKRTEAEYLGYEAHPYNAMLDLYEPGLSVQALNPVFDALAQGTRVLLDKIGPHTSSVHDAVLYRSYPKNEQLEFARSIVQQLGFSFETGRVDLSAHPFCTSFAITDVRLTTRVFENDLRSCLFGLIHESGHGMYEQGINRELEFTAVAEGASMGIHESQSLFWENIIARSEEFWVWAFPKLRDAFPDQLADQTPESFFKAVNAMRPSLNRVESDELTYNLHIILRFGIERDLMDGTLTVADIPEMWNAGMRNLLGVVPANDAEGCLQDVHWSFGGIGYFPSYTLGKLYGAMLWNSLKTEIPDVAAKISSGTFAPILSWLRTNIHQYGRTEKPAEIISRVCGRLLTEKDFLDYIGAKAACVYGV